MIENIKKIIDELIKLLQDDCVNRAKQLQETYFEIKSIIGHSPSNLEELDEIREYIKNEFEEKMITINVEIKKLMRNIDILEGH